MTESDKRVANKVLGSEQTQRIKAASAESVCEVERVITEILGFSDTVHSIRECIMIDYYVSAVWFAANECQFNEAQLSAFYTIIHGLLNAVARGLSLDESVVALKILLVGIGLENPRSSAVYASDMPTLFSVAEAKLIIDYLDISLFQHYRLFRLFFHEQAECTNICEQLIADHKAAEEHEIDVISKLSPETVCKVIRSIFDEMLVGFEEDIKMKLTEKENELMARVNAIHVVQDSAPEVLS